MVDGIMARVGSHSEVETLAAYSKIPIINALSDLYHPTQTLASLLTLSRIYSSRKPTTSDALPPPPKVSPSPAKSWSSLLAPRFQPETQSKQNPLECLRGLKVAWIGDCNNVVNDMIVAYPRLGMELRVACPGGKDGEYGLDKRVFSKLYVYFFTSPLRL
jgi:ornithine carbamoyltransferase